MLPTSLLCVHSSAVRLLSWEDVTALACRLGSVRSCKVAGESAGAATVLCYACAQAVYVSYWVQSKRLPGAQLQAASHREAGALRLRQVGPRPVWKDAQHPLRHHPALQLKGIPTLVRWRDGAPGARLDSELEAASTPDEADRLIRDFVAAGLKDGAAAAGNGSGGVDVQALIKELDQASISNGTVAH